MPISLRSLGLAAAIAIISAVPVHAQVSGASDFSDVLSACVPQTASIEGCRNAISSHHASLRTAGVSQDNIDALHRSLATSLGIASQSGGNAPVIASGLDHLANLISDPSTSAYAAQLGNAVRTGFNQPGTAVGFRRFASPN